MSCERKNKAFFEGDYFAPRKFFNMCFISMYSVLNALSKYTYFYISKNITSCTLSLSNKT